MQENIFSRYWGFGRGIGEPFLRISGLRLVFMEAVCPVIKDGQTQERIEMKMDPCW